MHYKMRSTSFDVSFESPGAQSLSSTDSGPAQFDVFRLKELCGALINEVVYLRAYVNRMLLWRADLQYQKMYLSLKVADLLTSQKATLTYIKGMGINPNFTAQGPLTPIKRFRTASLAVISIFRMRILARIWQEVVSESSREVFPLPEGSELSPTKSEMTTPDNILYYQRRGQSANSDRASPTIWIRRVQGLEDEMTKLIGAKQQLERILSKEQARKHAIEQENERLVAALHELQQPLSSRYSPGPQSSGGQDEQLHYTRSLYSPKHTPSIEGSSPRRTPSSPALSARSNGETSRKPPTAPPVRNTGTAQYRVNLTSRSQPAAPSVQAKAQPSRRPNSPAMVGLQISTNVRGDRGIGPGVRPGLVTNNDFRRRESPTTGAGRR
ncbi:hypothetical protein BJ742DRAFT_101601 [Cladochytrium replicatum]|nr:hypothetical protein BJ742DRAFT_101601 [Cladochytrium replicatum]